MTDPTPTDHDPDRAEAAFRSAMRVPTDHETITTGPDLVAVRRRVRNRAWWQIGACAAGMLMLAAVLVSVADRSEIMGRVPIADDSTTTAADQPDTDQSEADPVPLRDGWRYETFLDVQIQVPDSWEYNPYPASQWCINPGPEAPYVDRGSPARATTDVYCGPQEPTRRFQDHVLFLATQFTEGTPLREERNGWLTVREPVGAAMVEIVSQDETLIDDILATASVVSFDQFGCPVSDPIQAGDFVRPAEPFDIGEVDSVVEIAVCRYLVGEAWSAEAGLADAHLLTGTAARDELSALQAAPIGGGPGNPADCAPEYSGYDALVIRLRSADDTYTMYVYYQACGGNGFDDGNQLRTLTRAACSPLFEPPTVLYDAAYPRVFDLCGSR